ncbi:hypothetical protein JCM10908_000105 [Rhodotorula pacifica]|uniref:uncharacterized protein n=1 Tax=Rhodotorula pacifica TaxID=1495444 RepID=UPI0031745826
MDPRFQQHVPPTGPSTWTNTLEPTYGGADTDVHRLSPHAQPMAPAMSPEARPGYPALAPVGHMSQDTSPAPGTTHPHMQSLPSVPPPRPDAHNLAEGMAHLGFQPSPSREASTPDSLAPQAVVPARGKRASRAYHDQAVSPAPQPTPSGSYLPPAQPSYFPPQQPSEPVQPSQSNGMMQHPHYQSAPPVASPMDPRTAPPASYHADGPGIPQPPHTAGQRIPGKQRIRIDPDHIPSPVNVQEADQQLYRVEPYLTCSRTPAPLASTDYVAVDQGNCNPRFLRMTTYSLPAADDLAIASQLPLGMVVQPFAALRPEEEPIPVVDFGETGPPRCERCRGYVNPWCVFVEGGQRFICNLCGHASEVAPEYFSHLDMSQRRIDLDQRPELRSGSVDFVVNRDYWVQDDPNVPGSLPRTPTPLHYVFAIDVSWTSIQCGLVGEITKYLKELLFHDEGEVPSSGPHLGRSGLPAGAKVAIVTFDRTVQFYNLKAGLEQAQMLVVPDITDMFLPLNEGFLVDPIASRSIIEGLLDSLPRLYASSSIVESAMTGPLKATMMALKTLGGQLNIFQTSLPTVGLGALKHREDSKLYGTEKEKTLFIPQDPFYRIAAEECVEAGIGINLFLFPSQYIDAATLGALPGLTGGDLFFHPRFDPTRDGLVLRAEIARVLQRETAYSVTMRIRCSNGLRIADHYGNFFQRNITDLEFGSIDADKAVAARIKHEGKLDEKVDAYFQCAALYTSAAGERRVRVHNLAVPVSNLISSVFRAADMDTTIAFVTKDAITLAASKTLRQVREQLTDACVKSLLAYRKHCASSTSPAQLILPESFKLFPLYALALIKTKALKGGVVASDVRAWAMRQLKSSGVSATLRHLYPRMLAVHSLPDDVGFPDERGQLILPRLMRTSYSRMEPHGAYLVENGDRAILWLGQAVSPQLLHDLYGVDSLDELDPRKSTLPVLSTRLSAQLRNILAYFESRAGTGCTPVLLARQNIDGTEFEFSNMLVEDSNNEQLSYVDYLCTIHQQIQSTLLGESKKQDANDSSSWTTW